MSNSENVPGNVPRLEEIFENKYYARPTEKAVWLRPITQKAAAIDRLLALDERLRIDIFRFFSRESGAVLDVCVETSYSVGICSERIVGTHLLYREPGSREWHQAYSNKADAIYALASCPDNKSRREVFGWFCHACGRVAQKEPCFCEIPEIPATEDNVVDQRLRQAQELVASLRHGPPSMHDAYCTPAAYRRWIEDSILPCMKKLIPELEEK